MTGPTPATRLTSPSRRHFLLGTVALGVLTACGTAPRTVNAGATQPTPAASSDVSASTEATSAAPTDSFEVTHTDAEWRQLLTPEQYNVLRDAGTEQPFSSPLNSEHAAGVFTCAGCALDLFSSTTEFDSGTGWPSFWQPLDSAVIEKQDTTMGMTRTEVSCHRCGGHLGHVFDDGPKPTGLRYCMNGVAMSFTAA